jgi:hypothetical protein
MAKPPASSKPTVTPDQRKKPKPRVTYSPELAEAICDHIAAGQPLTAFCKGAKRPTRKVVYEWLATYETFRVLWDAAQRMRADQYVEDMVRIADTTIDPHKARLQIETRKWIATKLNPEKLGEKTTLEHVGKDGGAIAVSLSEPERKARILTLVMAGLERAKKDPGGDGGDGGGHVA